MSEPKLILASSSPRRKELLSLLRIQFEIIPSSVDEAALIAQLGIVTPQILVQELAVAKARDIASKHRDAVVIGADTIVVIDGMILGKPVDEAEAVSMLRRLSGRQHEVYTGVAIAYRHTEHVEFDSTKVKFRILGNEEIEHYVATGDPMDKAGAYGIQNTSISPVATIDGDYNNVMGLPIYKLRDHLSRYFANLPIIVRASFYRPNV